jgi:hypothetical protein
MNSTIALLVAVGTSLLVVAVSCGDTLPAADEPPTAAADIARLVDQLEAPEFSQRQEASRKLTEAGRRAFEEIEKAAQSGTREAAIRAIEILKNHFSGGDEQSREAAKAALERLAKSENAAAAQRANLALNPPAEPQGIPINAFQPAMLPMMAPARIQIQMGNVGNRVVRRTSVRTINGQREIEHQDGDKITKVKDVPGGGIEAETTEKVNGKDITRKVEAKDLDDLKKKDADAARIYEQYGTRAARPGVANPILQNPDAIKRQLESIERVLERTKAQVPNNPAAQRSVDSLQRLKDQYEQRLKDAEKQAAVPAKPADPPNPFDP